MWNTRDQRYIRHKAHIEEIQSWSKLIHLIILFHFFYSSNTLNQIKNNHALLLYYPHVKKQPLRYSFYFSYDKWLETHLSRACFLSCQMTITHSLLCLYEEY